MLPRRDLGVFDWPLLLGVLGVSLVGVLVIHSATSQNPGLEGLATRQLFWIGAGLLALLVMQVIDYHTVAEFTPFVYVATVLVLVYLLIYGRSISGTRGWLEFGPLNLQPAEFAKIVVVLAVATYAATRGGLKLGLRSLVTLVLIGSIPLILILRQPDLGTALTLLPVILVTVFVAGIQVRVLVILLLVLALALPVAWVTYFKPYQKERILTFFDPERDPRGAGYQVRQSKIAVGSGGFAGKGLYQGTQSQLQFLPAQQTDFVFAVLAEEFGFAGAGGVVGLYFFLTFRCLTAARLARDKLGRYIALGFGTAFVLDIVVNPIGVEIIR